MASSLLVLFGGFVRAQIPVGTVGPPFRVNTDGASDGGGDGSATIVVGGDTMLAVWASNNQPDGLPGTETDIRFASSTNGSVWTAPQALNSNAATDSGFDSTPTVATDGAGNWVVVWSSNTDLNGPTNTDNEILVARSADDGQTWTAPAVLNSNAVLDNFADQQPAIATDGLGTWVTVWKGNGREFPQPGTTDIVVSRSLDNGATWSQQDRIDLSCCADVGTDLEPQITTDSHGRWVVVWTRMSPELGNDQDIAFSFSDDGGLTWSPPAAVNNYAATDNAVDFSPAVATDGDGVWVVAWGSSATPPGGQSGSNTDILAARSVDNGATWGNAQALQANAATDVGVEENPRVAMDAAGNVIAVWVSNGRLPDGSLADDWDIVASISRDAGQSWSGMFYANQYAGPDGSSDRYLAVAIAGPGEAVMSWSGFTTPRGASSADDDILAARLQYIKTIPAVSSRASIALVLAFLIVGTVVIVRRRWSPA